MYTLTSIRHHNAAESNFDQLLRLRKDDVLQLDSWLMGEHRKWLSPEIQNEVFQLFADEILRQKIAHIKQMKYYAVILDESTDISVLEQLSFSVRVVGDDLQAEEIWCGFYEVNDVTAANIFKVLKDVLQRFSLNIKHCRGQGYDGASNMAGKFGGVQALMLAEEQRALYVHCFAHSLNLVVQHALKSEKSMRDTMSMVGNMVTFVRDSPKRLHWFKEIAAEMEDCGHTQGNIKSWCPTRWNMRAASLSGICQNYRALLEFFNEVDNQDSSEVGVVAHGFVTRLLKFETFFSVELLRLIFQTVDRASVVLQGVQLHFSEAKELIVTMKNALQGLKTEERFDNFWKACEAVALKNGIDDAEMPRQRKRSVEGTPEASSVKDFFQGKYIAYLDVVVESIMKQFVDSAAAMHILNVERFLVQDDDDSLLMEHLRGILSSPKEWTSST